jgi:ribose-phosphate pyrophosphokinase
MSKYTLVTGTAHPQFAKDVAKILNIELCPVNISSFSDGEINLQITKSVRGKHVMILQSTCAPANKNIMELLLMIDALKRSSAKLITAIIPYFGYARQDRKAAPRVPISAKLIADLLETAGVSRVITMDLHAAQMQGFFNIPVDNIYGSIIFSDYLKKQNIDKEKTIIASPDLVELHVLEHLQKVWGLKW